MVIVTTSTGLGSPGIANVFNGSGDELLTQALLGNGPLGVTLNTTGTEATTANSDGTINSYEPSTTLESYEVQVSTLLQPAQPINLLPTTDYLFVTEPNVSAVSVLSGTSGNYQFFEQIPVAPSPINFAGNSGGARIYAISQDNGSHKVAFGDCETPSQVTSPGQAVSIETASITISGTFPVGICPVYGLTSTDNNRTYVLNRGSGTITVINSQLNQLDNTPNVRNLNPATGTLTLPPPAGFTGASFNAGPVFADFYPIASQLVTANYDSNTISIVNVSLDEFGNDSSLFGKTVTVPVGNGPAAVTILRDGSRAYVANQKDGTVSVVNLTTFQVQATIPVTGHPTSIASIFSTPYGQVFVTSPDQPYMTVIRTDTDEVEAKIELDGNGIDVHTSVQYAGLTNANSVVESHASGSGAPCGLGAVCTR
jgi:YVTN family beta-propeller protein